MQLWPALLQDVIIAGYERRGAALGAGLMEMAFCRALKCDNWSPILPLGAVGIGGIEV